MVLERLGKYDFAFGIRKEGSLNLSHGYLRRVSPALRTYLQYLLTPTPESLVKRLESAYLRSAVNRTFSRRVLIGLFYIIVPDWVFFKIRTLYVHSVDTLDRTPVRARLSQRMRRHQSMRMPHISWHLDLE